MEFEEEVVLFVLLHRTLQKKKRKHKFWIHPVLNSRQERDVLCYCTGHYRRRNGSINSGFIPYWIPDRNVTFCVTAFNALRNYESNFLTCCRMSVRPFDELLQDIVSDTSGSDNEHEKMCSSRRVAESNLAVGLIKWTAYACSLLLQ